MSAEEQASVDALLDMNLDDIADLPEFKPFPAGAYHCKFNLESKVVNKHPSIEAKLKLVAVAEMSDPTQVPPNVDDETGVLFMMDNEFGAGKFKEVAKILAPALGTSNVKEIVAKSKNLDVMVVTKVRINKDTKQEYTDIVTLTML